MLRTPMGRTRLEILAWLKDPADHFPRGRQPDPGEDGVTSRAVAAKLGVPRRVADSHLRLLAGIGLLRTKRIRHRTYYRRDEIRIAEVSRLFERGW
ncbi:ArsR family transcriptional regulator [Streptomyces sp. NPDC004752]